MNKLLIKSLIHWIEIVCVILLSIEYFPRRTRIDLYLATTELIKELEKSMES